MESLGHMHSFMHFDFIPQEIGLWKYGYVCEYPFLDLVQLTFAALLS